MKLKIFYKIILIMFFIILFQLIVYPNTVKAGLLDDIITQGRNFTNRANLKIDKDDLNNQNAMIFNILFGVGVALTVGVGGVLGIQFIMASAEDKAKIKEKMIPYIVGCVIIYGAFAIWKVTVTILAQMG